MSEYRIVIETDEAIAIGAQDADGMFGKKSHLRVELDDESVTVIGPMGLVSLTGPELEMVWPMLEKSRASLLELGLTPG